MWQPHSVQDALKRPSAFARQSYWWTSLMGNIRCRWMLVNAQVKPTLLAFPM